VRYKEYHDVIFLKLHQPHTNIAFVYRGQEVTFELSVEAIGGDFYNSSLVVASGGDSIKTRLSPTVAAIINESKSIFSVTFTAPHVDNISTEYRIWVNVQSDEATSNNQQLILIYNYGELSEDEGLPFISMPITTIGAMFAGVVATSFRGDKPQRS